MMHAGGRAETPPSDDADELEAAVAAALGAQPRVLSAAERQTTLERPVALAPLGGASARQSELLYQAELASRAGADARHAPSSADVATVSVPLPRAPLQARQQPTQLPPAQGARRGARTRPQSAHCGGGGPLTSASVVGGHGGGGALGGHDRAGLAGGRLVLRELESDYGALGDLLAAMGPSPEDLLLALGSDAGLRRRDVSPALLSKRAQSASRGGRAGGAFAHRRRRDASPPPPSTALDDGSFTEVTDLREFAGAARSGRAASLLPDAEPPHRRRARSVRRGGRHASPPPEDAEEAPGAPRSAGYLVGLRTTEQQLNPYLAEQPMQFRIPLKAMPDGKKGGGGGDGVSPSAAHLLHEQRLRILSSLYGAPFRGL